MVKRHRILSFFVMLVLMFLVSANGKVAYADVQEGFYFHLSEPVFISINDFLDDTDTGIHYINMTPFSDIYLILDGKMTTMQELMDKDWDDAFYPIDPTKLKPAYTRIKDGSTITIDQSGMDPEPPEVEYIR